jgi:hypothetical protein
VPVAQPARPGAVWHEHLDRAFDGMSAHLTMEDLRDVVVGCDVGLVDLVGWLCDEIAIGRVRLVGPPAAGGFGFAPVEGRSRRRRRGPG